MLAQHGLFQTYFYAAHLGLDPNARDKFRSDPAYEQTIEFCAKYDEVSFDPAYKNEPLSTFEPMVRPRSVEGLDPAVSGRGASPRLEPRRSRAISDARAISDLDGGRRPLLHEEDRSPMATGG